VAAVAYSVTLNGTEHAVKVGDVVNSSSVTNTWASVLAALEFKLEATNLVTVTRDDSTQSLTLTATAANTAFTASAAKRDTGLGSPSNPLPVAGDYVVIIPDRTAGDFGMAAADSLTIVALPTNRGELINLRAGADDTPSGDSDLVVVSPINVGRGSGGGSVELRASGGVTLGGQVTAESLVVHVGGDLSLTTDVGAMAISMTRAGDLTVVQAGALNLTSLAILGEGDVTIVADGNINIGTITGVAGNITLTSKTGGINITSLASGGDVTLSAVAGGITLGSSSSTVEMDSIAITAKDAITIYELDDLRIEQLVSTDGDAVKVVAGGLLTLDGAITATGANAVELTTTGSTSAIVLNQAVRSTSGAVTLTSGGAMTLGASGDITSTSGNVRLDSGGALTMTGETEINAGSGTLTIEADGQIMLGKLRSTNSSNLNITSGQIVDAAEGSIDIIAQTAQLVIQAVGGIGTLDNPIEIDVASLDISNSGGGDIGLVESGTMLINRLEQTGGAASLSTTAGTVTVAGAASATGNLSITAGGSGSAMVVNAPITSTSGTVTLGVDGGDLSLASNVTGVNVSLTLSNGSLLNAGLTMTANDGLGTNRAYKDNWLTKTVNGSTVFDPVIQWLMSRGYTTTEVATGKIVVSGLQSYQEANHLPNGTILRQAFGPFIKATGTGNPSDPQGAVRIAVKGTIGQATAGFDLSPGSIMLNGITLNTSSSDRGAMYMLATDTILVESLGQSNSDKIASNASKGGETALYALNGTLKTLGMLDANGESVDLGGFDVDIRAAVRSPDGALSLSNRNLSGTMVFGDSAIVGAYQVDPSELALLRPGFSQVNIGGDFSSNKIVFGSTTDTSASEIVFKDDVSINNPVVGGQIQLNQSVSVSGNLRIKGSGFTTYWNQNALVSVTDTLSLDDSLILTGHVTAMAGSDGSGDVILGGQSWHIINGDSQAGADSLTVKAPGNVTFMGRIGFAEPGQTLHPQDPFEGLSVAGVEVSVGAGVFNLPDDVTFEGEVLLHGDLTLQAAGTVRFAQSVNIQGGNLTILGAERVIFEGALAVNPVSGVGGNIVIEANEIDFLGGSQSVSSAGGQLTLRSTSLGLGYEVGDPPYSDPQRLNLSSRDLMALVDGFGQIVIGHVQGGHAVSGAAEVRIGSHTASSAPLFWDNLAVYGGSIVVADMPASPDFFLQVAGSITLDAVNNITLQNRIEAGLETPEDITLYSAQGLVLQSNAVSSLGDGVQSEALVADTLTVRTATGADLRFLDVNEIQATNTSSGAMVFTQLAGAGQLDVKQLSQVGTGLVEVSTTDSSLRVLSSAQGGLGVLSAGTGSVNLLAKGSESDALIARTVTLNGGALTIEAGQDVVQSAALSNTKGLIEVHALGRDALLQAGVSSDGFIEVSAARDLTQSDGQALLAVGSSGFGAANLFAGRNLTISRLQADGGALL
jgi:hypothetical protein